MREDVDQVIVEIWHGSALLELVQNLQRVNSPGYLDRGLSTAGPWIERSGLRSRLRHQTSISHT